MGRVIIDYEDGDQDSPDQSLSVAVALAARVIMEGRISQSAGVPHFCWHTSFTNGYEVSTRRKKKGQTSDSFYVRLGR